MGKGKGKGADGECHPCGFLCFACCAGPILLIIGVVFFVQSFTPTRALKIKALNADITKWNSVKSAFSSAPGFSVQVGNAASVPLPKTMSTPNLHDTALTAAGSKFLGFTSTLYTAAVPGGFAGSTPYNNIPVPVSFTDPSGTITTVSIAPFQTESLGPSALNCGYSTNCQTTRSSYRSRRTCSSASCYGPCAARGGVWSGSAYSGTCAIPMVLTRACVRVVPSGNTSGYRLDVPSVISQISGSDQGGCSKTSTGWPIALYAPGSVLGSPVFTVMDAYDPSITASALTNGCSSCSANQFGVQTSCGTGCFGLSAAQNAAIGIGFMVGAGVWFLLVCLCLWACSTCCRHRKPRYVPDYGHMVPRAVYYAPPQPQGALLPQQQAYAPVAQPASAYQQPGYGSAAAQPPMAQPVYAAPVQQQQPVYAAQQQQPVYAAQPTGAMDPPVAYGQQPAYAAQPAYAPQAGQQI